jgi:Na+-transporting NADH:ubiquinone oxidoreductase subunit B
VHDGDPGLARDARATTLTERDDSDRYWVLALTLPLLLRLHGDGRESAVERLILLAMSFGLAYGWAALFARRAARPLGPGLPAFAMTFALVPAAPMAMGGAVLALSFGAVFGREVFGGRGILPPALVGLAFAVFSFPEGGVEVLGVLDGSPDHLFVISCVPGAAILMRRGALAWQVAAGAVVGAAAVGLLMGDPGWWMHPGLGAFAPGMLFLAAAPEGTIDGKVARGVHGILVGALVVVIRLGDSDQPDGVVFAVLLGGLFAPLIDRTLSWRPRHG